MQSVVDRFLKYVKYETTSSENSATCPSTEGQMVFAKELANELKNIGLSDVRRGMYKARCIIYKGWNRWRKAIIYGASYTKYFYRRSQLSRKI